MNGRAPKGGVSISGVFYRGGQFLPSNNEPKRGMFNANNVKSAEHKSIARALIKQAFKCKFNGDDMSAEFNITMAQSRIKKAQYWENK
jgi:hypothetical protein